MVERTTEDRSTCEWAGDMCFWPNHETCFAPNYNTPPTHCPDCKKPIRLVGCASELPDELVSLIQEKMDDHREYDGCDENPCDWCRRAMDALYPRPPETTPEK